jgi:DHA2 family multidrug resistance protein
MTGWTVEMGSAPFIITGLTQGVGLGLIFIPLNIIAFATLPQHYRTEGSSLMNLFRNIGASAGISVVTALLARNIQTNHQVLGGHITGYSLSSIDPSIASLFGSAGESVTALIDATVNQQAAMIAYLDDFKLMMFLTAAALPLVLLLRRPPKPEKSDEPMHVAFE